LQNENKAKYQGNGKLFLEFSFIDQRILLPGKNHVTDFSARDHPSGFLLALKGTGRNSFSKLPLNSAILNARKYSHWALCELNNNQGI